MMWVIRAGKNSLHYDKYIQNSKVYIPWDGYQIDFSELKTRGDFRAVVMEEKGIDNRISVSNWAGQLYIFTRELKKGDLVLIPAKGSRTYCLAKIESDYHYDKSEKDKLYHCREIEIMDTDIPRDIFSQSVIYSLGAFRTIFRVKHEEEIVKTIMKWKEAFR